MTSSDTSLSPAERPCGSCPYRCDVPSGVWEAVEYEKLPRYDRPTGEQPAGIFLCHQQDGRMCAGWVGCHDAGELLAIRLAAMSGRLTLDELDALWGYQTPVPLFSSGREAAEHGLREIDAPTVNAERTMESVMRKRARRAVA